MVMIESIPVIVLALSSVSANPAASAPAAEPATIAPVTLRAEPLKLAIDAGQQRAEKTAQREPRAPLAMTELHVARDANGELVARCRVVGSPNFQGALRPRLLDRELQR